MSDRSSSRLNALNRSINWKLDQIEQAVVQQPIKELMALCDVKIFPLTLNITVWPDGSLLTTHVYEMRDSWGNGTELTSAI